jgi:hypothetical protein
MRVRVQVSGGMAAFPGLAAPRTIDVEALQREDRLALGRLIEDARFFDLPRRLLPPPGSADYQSAEITIEDGERRHTVTVADPVSDPAVQALVARLRELAFPHP